jgi:hypothetical protein
MVLNDGHWAQGDTQPGTPRRRCGPGAAARSHTPKSLPTTNACTRVRLSTIARPWRNSWMLDWLWYLGYGERVENAQHVSDEVVP